MMYPSQKTPQVPSIKRIEWNGLKSGDFIVITRSFKTTTYHFFGKVSLLEKLRNCHMLHFKIWECWYDGASGRECWWQEIESVTKKRRQRGSAISVISTCWKKPKGSIVCAWDPTIAMGPSFLKTRRGRHSNPSDSTQAHLGLPPSAQDIDDILREKAQQRQAYAAHRFVFQASRDELSEALLCIGLTREVNEWEFKTMRRKLMMKWHPDREFVFIENGGTPIQFRKKSSTIIAAIAKVQHSLFPITVLLN